MRNFITGIAFMIAFTSLSGQAADPLVSKCAMNAGNNTKYLKDFKVQLGKSNRQVEMRYRATISLWKNTRYRFSMCNEDNSKGRLILDLRDETNNVVLSSYDRNSGNIRVSVDFTCNKSGIYQLCYDFDNFQQGSGIGIVSILK